MFWRRHIKSKTQREVLRVLLQEGRPLTLKNVYDATCSKTSSTAISTLISYGLVQRAEGYFLNRKGVEAARDIFEDDSNGERR